MIPLLEIKLYATSSVAASTWPSTFLPLSRTTPRKWYRTRQAFEKSNSCADVERANIHYGRPRLNKNNFLECSACPDVRYLTKLSCYRPPRRKFRTMLSRRVNKSAGESV